MSRIWYNRCKCRNYLSAEVIDLLSVYQAMQTALHLACRKNHVQVAKFLVSNGGDMNIKDKVCSEDAVSFPSGSLLCVFRITNFHMNMEILIYRPY